MEMWALADIEGYQKVIRKNDHAVQRMVDSIRTYGFKIPVLVTREGEVIDGHLRVKAARELGVSEVPVIVCEDWTSEQVRAFRLLVNRSASWAEWDWTAVAEELNALSGQNYDLKLTGFDSREITDLLRARENPDVPFPTDRASEPVLSSSGDGWLLGD